MVVGCTDPYLRVQMGGYMAAGSVKISKDQQMGNVSACLVYVGVGFCYGSTVAGVHP